MLPVVSLASWDFGAPSLGAPSFGASGSGTISTATSYRTPSVARVTFLVDTGATDVVLAPDDAQRIGCDMANLKFTQFAETANGTVRGAPVTLQSLIIGPIDITGMPATVNGAEMSDSLLGMAFLNRLSGWRVENGVLTLEPYLV